MTLHIQKNGIYVFATGVGKDGMQGLYFKKGDAVPDDEKVAYMRYRAYVSLWNDIYHGPGGLNQENRPEDERVHSDITKVMADEAGLAHYHALLAQYGATNLPPYFSFEDYTAADDTWSDGLEVGLVHALVEHNGVITKTHNGINYGEKEIDFTQFENEDQALEWLLNTYVPRYGDLVLTA